MSLIAVPLVHEKNVDSILPGIYEGPHLNYQGLTIFNPYLFSVYKKVVDVDAPRSKLKSVLGISEAPKYKPLLVDRFIVYGEYIQMGRLDTLDNIYPPEEDYEIVRTSIRDQYQHQIPFGSEVITFREIELPLNEVFVNCNPKMAETHAWFHYNTSDSLVDDLSQKVEFRIAETGNHLSKDERVALKKLSKPLKNYEEKRKPVASLTDLWS